MKVGELMTGINVIIRYGFVWLRGGPAAPHAVPRRSV
jgi:hypothetical protein